MARVGSRSGAYVYDLNTSRPLYSLRSLVARVPASVEKLYTTSTALEALGPAATLDTTVLGVGTLDPSGVWRGDLYLRGAGDPTFGSRRFDRDCYGTGATVQTLADELVARAGLQSVHGRILGDDSVFDAVRGGPSRGCARDTDVGGLSGLAFDRGATSESGTGSEPDPASFAALALAGALRRLSLPVSGRSGRARTPAGAVELARVHSPPMRTLALLTNRPSDNYLAEMLIKVLGARSVGLGSTAAGARAIRTRLATLGLHPHIVDGSGLSRSDRTSPHDVVTLLTSEHTGAAGLALRSSLAVAGRNGTLIHRMRGTRAQGNCRAKTGTLSGVSALAGYCTAANGHDLAFAFLFNGVSQYDAHRAQDRMAEALAAYSG
ncbi:MAG TPA: D-alanyl-D-alanine carboxypeptidase/D-alanyl-D-alanine-endopeptidase [Solirubrobacteraceae bacterium]|jgi:D-alanyl-D-alanine carboxypeptidase/D-alanyl-D-alanine-endopeptidase (penicillin-binding protein 4)|nr:D-alanyl-D-alanine carboxypeptidase/D-alanyl-D-alanine-endopeptidase [Solirubrobacteraceae bacterium]